MRPLSSYAAAQSAIMDDFRRLTIGAMRQATSSMRLTVEQSQATLGSTRAALVRLRELASTIDHELTVRRAMAAIPEQPVDEDGFLRRDDGRGSDRFRS